MITTRFAFVRPELRAAPSLRRRRIVDLPLVASTGCHLLDGIGYRVERVCVGVRGRRLALRVVVSNLQQRARLSVVDDSAIFGSSVWSGEPSVA